MSGDTETALSTSHSILCMVNTVVLVFLLYFTRVFPTGFTFLQGTLGEVEFVVLNRGEAGFADIEKGEFHLSAAKRTVLRLCVYLFPGEDLLEAGDGSGCSSTTLSRQWQHRQREMKSLDKKWVKHSSFIPPEGETCWRCVCQECVFYGVAMEDLSTDQAVNLI